MMFSFNIGPHISEKNMRGVNPHLVTKVYSLLRVGSKDHRVFF